MKSVSLLKFKVCVLETKNHSKRVRMVTLCLSFLHFSKWYYVFTLVKLTQFISQCMSVNFVYIGNSLVFYQGIKPLHFCSKTNKMLNISNLFYFGTTLYMFRTVSPSIIRSQVLWLHDGGNASKQPQNLYDMYLMLYVQSYSPDDGRKDRPTHVQDSSKINKIEIICILFLL
jgi:hypothetical protein